MEITVRNANQMFAEVFWKLRASGVPVQTRNGPAVRIAEPVLTRMRYPAERVLFHAGRDANPVFHLMEALWMLAGRNDVAFLQQFNSKIGQYSDDGKAFNAAYGYRWRHHFGTDQLLGVIDVLRADPASRQAVVQMWDAEDLTRRTKDKACNTQLIFELLDGRLNMVVLNRSNDAWWGYAGANVVHFTVLQEFVALALGVRLGEYRTFSTNLHLYTELYDATRYLEHPPSVELYDHYDDGSTRPRPLFTDGDYVGFLRGCEEFCTDPFNTDRRYAHAFFQDVAVPVAKVSEARKTRAGDGSYWAGRVRAEDWRRAAQDWVHRRNLARDSR